jgi:hypothetical protein
MSFSLDNEQKRKALLVNQWKQQQQFPSLRATAAKYFCGWVSFKSFLLPAAPKSIFKVFSS